MSSNPFSVKRGIHVEFDPITGTLKGFPAAWETAGLVPQHILQGSGKVDISAISTGSKKPDPDFHTGAAAAQLYASFDRAQQLGEQMTEAEIRETETLRAPAVAQKTANALKKMGPLQLRQKPEHNVHVELVEGAENSQNNSGMSTDCHVDQSNPPDSRNAKVLRGLPIEWAVQLKDAGVTEYQLEDNGAWLKNLQRTVEVTATLGYDSGKSGRLRSQVVDLTPQEASQAKSLFVSIADPRELLTDLKLMGKGAQGRVYRARFVKNNKICAVKVVQLPSTDSGDALVRVQKEAVLQWRAQHECVIGLERVLITQNQVWLVQEYAQFGSLAGIVHMGGIRDEPTVAGILQKVLCALEHLHKNGVLLRDLKASNVLLGRMGRVFTVKLSDFGAAAQISPKGLRRRSSVVGTAHWMAPEVVRGKPYDYSCDIWSAGALAIEIYTGAPPRTQMPPLQAAFQTAVHGLGKQYFPEGISAEFEQFLDACFILDPDQRPGAAQLLEMDFFKRAELQGIQDYVQDW